jgi:hypothetical protein
MNNTQESQAWISGLHALKRVIPLSSPGPQHSLMVAHQSPGLDRAHWLPRDLGPDYAGAAHGFQSTLTYTSDKADAFARLMKREI